MDFQELPTNHAPSQLLSRKLCSNPFEQLISWMEYAKQIQIEELNAMALATASKTGIPSCRMVLLKHLDENGLVFYTNYESRKAKELTDNPYATAVIFWPKVMLQIVVEGTVEKVSKEMSEEYFHSRHRESQIAAMASKQGSVIPSKEVLESRCEEIRNQFDGKEIPLPSFWGGFRLVPNRFEFWQGGHHRLHDRFQYLKLDDRWEISRLSP